VTISLGVAEYLPGESRDDWFERVDRAMYRAKVGGRNRVVVDRRGGSEVWGQDRQGAVIELAWHDSYASGHPEIDAEHRMLFDLANRVMRVAFVPEPDHGRLVTAVSSLVDHVQQHFEHEERILAAHEFPGLAGHSKAHRHLLHRAREIEASIRSGVVNTGSLIEFLARELVLRHMLTADRTFFELLSAE
jgi:diguanylate cyclase